MTTADHVPVSSAKPRHDILVSVCFGDLSASPCAFDAVATLGLEVAARFRFHEIIVVADESHKDVYLPLIHRVENLRLFTVRNGTAFYRRRVIAAEEAIGDVVLLASATELPGVNAVELIERAAELQSAVLVTRSSKPTSRSIGAMLVFLGRMAGFKVNMQDLQTLALPRTLLNQLLAHSDPDLALRFPPRDARVPLVLVGVAPGTDVRREAGLRRRLLLLQTLLVYMAPRLLMAVTLTSALLAIFGFLFGLYTLGVWFIQENVAPGWLTLSAAISLTAFFLGVSTTGLSLGLQQLLSRTKQDSLDGTVSEVNRVDLFGQVASDLNIELERSRGESNRTPAA